MKTTFTKFSLVTLLILSLSNLSAQWSEIGVPGFSSGASSRNVTAVSGSTIYMAYADATPKANVMKSTGGAWSQVGLPAFSPSNIYALDMEVDAAGVPHVAMYDNAGKISVMKFNGTAWVAVGTGTFATSMLNQDIGIAFDNANAPNVVFTNAAATNKATVMKFNGTAWVTVGVAGFSAGQATLVRIARNSSGVLYVAYQDNANLNRGTVMNFNGTAWVMVGGVSATANGVLGSIDLGINSTGTPYLVYRDGALGNKASVRSFNGTAWVQTGTAGFWAGAADYCRIAFNASGNPYISYLDVTTSNRATVMGFNGTTWATIGSAGFSGGNVTYTSIFFNSTGMPCVGYSDGSLSSRSTVMKYCTAATGSITSVVNGSVCSSGNVTVTATANPGNVFWYNAPTNGSFLSSSNSYTPMITSNQTYYVAAVDANGCVSPVRTMVTASVIPLPTILSFTAASICSGSTAIIGATPSMGSVNWYTISVGSTPLATTTSFTTPVLTANKIYYAEATNMGCPNMPRTAITVTVSSTPVINATPASSTICPGTSLVITASGAPTYTWNTGANTATLSVTPSITTVYTVSGKSGSCVGTKTVGITVSALPTVSLSSSASLMCTSGTGGASLVLTGTPAGGVYSGANLTGATFNAPASAGTYTATYSYTNTTTTCSNTAVALITVNVCTGLNELAYVDKLNIYPNPNNGVFSIIVPEKGIYTIVNSIGQTIEVLEVKDNTDTIHIENLVSGIYYVIGKTSKAKIVVSK